MRATRGPMVVATWWTPGEWTEDSRHFVLNMSGVAYVLRLAPRK